MAPTGIVHSPLSLEHETGKGHVESKSRYETVMTALRTSGVLARAQEWVALPCDEQPLLLCHDAGYVRLVQTCCAALKEGEVADLPTGDVKISRGSYAAACAMVGGALHAADCLMDGRWENCFVVGRPPGHHAERCRGMGFCLFNTVAITARYLQKRYNIEKIAIIDWDVHHGNGTEQEFSDDTGVYYFSTHQQGGYPGTGQETFHGSSGNICNHPMLPGSTSREQFLSYYCQELPSIMDLFHPDVVLISCGFDAHRLDPLASLALESEDFATLTHAVRGIAERWAKGRLLSVLEGGYHLQALAASAVAHVRELARRPTG